jgi:hypothetical protein
MEDGKRMGKDEKDRHRNDEEERHIPPVLLLVSPVVVSVIIVVDTRESTNMLRVRILALDMWLLRLSSRCCCVAVIVIVFTVALVVEGRLVHVATTT